MDLNKTGIFIALLRKQKNITQKELADAIGVTDKAVSRWETGKGFPDVSSLIPLAEALGVSVGEIIAGERTEVDKEAVEILDKTLISALDYSQDKIKRSRRRNIITICVSAACAVVILFGAVFSQTPLNMAAYNIINILIVATLFIGVPILIGVYVYRDAIRHGMNAMMWVLIAMLAPALTGLIVYLIVRVSYSNVRPEDAASLPERNAPLGKIIIIALIPLLLFVSLAMINFASVGTSMAYSTESLSVEDFAGHQKIAPWMEKCDEGPIKAYALRYKAEEYGRTQTYYLIYLPSLGGTNSRETLPPSGMFSRNLEVRIQEDSHQFEVDKYNKLISISYKTSAKGHPGISVFVNGQKMGCEITDVDYNPTINH